MRGRGTAVEKLRSSLGDDRLTAFKCEVLPFEGEDGPTIETYHLKDRSRCQHTLIQCSCIRQSAK